MPNIQPSAAGGPPLAASIDLAPGAADEPGGAIGGDPARDHVARRAPRTRADGTRTSILEATATIIGEAGWEAATTRSIARRARVNPALVHYHFGSLERLRRDAVVAALGGDVAAAIAPLAGARSFVDGVRAVATELDRFDIAGPPGALFAEVLLRATRDAALRDSMSGVLGAARAAVRERLARAIEAGEVRPTPDPAGTAAALGAMLDGLLLHRLADPSFQPGRAVEAILELLVPETQGAR